jgi:Tfp pilus assembly protein PilF
MRYALAIVVVLAGCATPSAPPPGTPSGSNPKAVHSLLEIARSDAAVGRFGTAAASMERAIRLDPRNARLWQELARLRLKQGEYVQAEHVALRSNSLTRADWALRMENWNIIAQARDARGDAEGARSARELAKRIEH